MTNNVPAKQGTALLWALQILLICFKHWGGFSVFKALDELPPTSPLSSPWTLSLHCTLSSPDGCCSKPLHLLLPLPETLLLKWSGGSVPSNSFHLVDAFPIHLKWIALRPSPPHTYFIFLYSLHPCLMNYKTSLNSRKAEFFVCWVQYWSPAPKIVP